MRSRTSASETMTVFGGAVAVPSAVRRSDSTTTMRVNDVIMTRMEAPATARSTARSSECALGQTVALSEVNADVLRGGRCRRDEDPGYPDRHRHKTDTAAGIACYDFPGGRPSKLAISSSRFSLRFLPGVGAGSRGSSFESHLGSERGSNFG